MSPRISYRAAAPQRPASRLAVLVMLSLVVTSGWATADIVPIPDETQWRGAAGAWVEEDFNAFTGVLRGQVAGLVFSSTASNRPFVLARTSQIPQGPVPSPPNYFYVGPGLQAGGGNWTVDFNLPTSAIAFWTGGLQFPGSTIRFFDDAGQLLGSFDLLSSGGGHDAYGIGFNGYVSSAPNISRVTVTICESPIPDWVWFDDFQWNPDASQPQPSPPNIPNNQVSLRNLWKWSPTAGRFVEPPNGDPVTINPDQPTYLLAHGWDAALDGVSAGLPCGLALPKYAMSAIGCAIYESNPNANILAWDWKSGANPNHLCDFPDNVANLVAAVVSNPPVSGLWATTIVVDARLSASNARREGIKLGKALADHLHNNGTLGTELHLIGHSHGGGLLGMAAQVMSSRYDPPYYPTSLTTLDTPRVLCLPFGCFVDSLAYVKADSVHPDGQVAVIYCEDRLHGGVGQKLTEDPTANLTNISLSVPPFEFVAHSWIQGPDRGPFGGECPTDEGWYPPSVWMGGERSPRFNDAAALGSILDVTEFLDGCFDESGYVLGEQYHFVGGDTCPRGDGIESETPGLSMVQLESFQTADSWSANNTELTVGMDPADATNRVILMHEDGDSSFFKDIAWPVNALEMTFEYMFLGARGEESLTVYLGDEIVYYDNAETTLATGGLTSSGSIYVGQAAGTTAQLNFVMRSDGTPGCELLLDNIRMFGLVPGDLNDDGNIDLTDLATMLAHFGTQTGATLRDGDVDGDSDVDLGDLSTLLSNFGTTRG